MTNRAWMTVPLAALLVVSACGFTATGEPLPGSDETQVTGSIGDDLPPVSQPEGCQTEPGSPIDLASEPAGWLAFGEYFRWTDTAGCPVRIDVISHNAGAEHCGWQAAEFITIGRPLGESVTQLSPEVANRYIWNPDGVIPGVPEATTIAVAELPATAVDTGYRAAQVSMWIDPADESTLYLVTGDTAQVWTRDFEAGLCA